MDKEEKLKRYRRKIEKLKRRLEMYRLEIAKLRVEKAAKHLPSGDDELYLRGMMRLFGKHYRLKKK